MSSKREALLQVDLLVNRPEAERLPPLYPGGLDQLCAPAPPLRCGLCNRSRAVDQGRGCFHLQLELSLSGQSCAEESGQA